MSTAGQRAQRIVIVASGGQRIAGGPAQPIKLLAAGAPTNGAPILRVCIVTGRATLGGPAWPCVQVSGAGGEGGDLLPVVLT